MAKREYHFWVYILSSRSRNLYVGITNKLLVRTEQHGDGTPGSFTRRYQVHRLVYFELHRYVRNAIGREKELKHYTRAEKIALIEKTNPTWDDLYARMMQFGTADPPRG
jgi:putative endonuclease